MAQASPSVGGLVRSAIDDVRALFREELALAKAEVRVEISKATAAGTRMGIAGIALWFAAMFLLIAAALGLSAAFKWPAWAGFGIVAIGLGIVGTAVGLSARNSLRRVQPLPRTVGTLKETFQ